jgi:ribonuclease E
MLVNYAPGEECRIAVLTDSNLEEFNAERFDAISRVGNIYVGKVQNIEPAIQAAFVDFGVADHGFLHITDLHPRYFPGEDEDTTERVGKKIPRRRRPPIQQCLKRGQRIVVQVLKEGVGTKGPTLTSYLSIPGRYIVMMPQMDRVGVSRKVEDEDQRRKMREILDQLDLPEGLGFILRTAGFDRTKTELKRDLAYLQRLWKDMQDRQAKGKAPRLLYSESDLLVRTLRDSLTSDVNEIIVDDEQALDRVSKFLKIVAPRSRPPLNFYDKPTPLFHAFGVERQIATMKAREVPLPSGGRLVFDETEALVAIDVNSGKSRSARDAETNAYKTNLEATDEICRQLRLRDMGGLVICDLIDMRDLKHRRAVEARFKERLKRDRARSTILPISGFGILEMTRQRMRASHESLHFTECPTCHGRGVVQKPSSVADDAIRSLAAIMAHDRVAKVEMVVSPRVASQLLSGRRTSLGRLEHETGRRVDVRVSETVPVGNVIFYAYDETGADIDVEKLPAPKAPTDLVAWQSDDDDADWAVDVKDELEPVAPEAQVAAHEPHPIEMEPGEAEQPKKKRRRRRRSKKSGEVQPDTTGAESGEAEDGAGEEAPEVKESGGGEPPADGEQPKKKRRRRRKKKSQIAAAQAGVGESVGESAGGSAEAEAESAPEDVSAGVEEGGESGADGEQPKKKRRRRRKKKQQTASGEAGAEPAVETAPVEAAEPEAGGEAPKKKRRRRRRRKSESGEATSGAGSAEGAKPTSSGGPASDNGSRTKADDTPEPAPEVKSAKRFVYSAGRRRLSASERSRGTEE